MSEVSAAARANVSTHPLPLFELVGPAGAGKSTVLAALREKGVIGGVRVRDWIRWPQLVARAAALQPLFWDLAWRAPGYLWESASHLLRLKAMYPAVQKLATTGAPVALDEGPVFLLARLAVYLNAGERSRALDLFCQNATEFWTDKLDAVIWLDAPDPVLVRRIRERQKSHRLKQEPEEAMVEFLQSYRLAYEQVLSKLLATGEVRRMAFDTSEIGPRSIAARVLTELETPCG
jgi:thymidylate kinase